MVNTLDVEDILEEGQRFGGEFKLEGSSNSTAPRLPKLHTGEDYRDVEGFPQTAPNFPYGDKTLQVDPKTDHDKFNVFSGEDYAYRLALGWRPTDNIDVFGAYAYRKRGNYFSGKHNSSYYSQEQNKITQSDDITNLAYNWVPGYEVLNSSSQMESWSFKTSWRPTDDQALQLGLRKSLSWYGEIMPSRISVNSNKYPIQWPLSRVNSLAYNLEYKWQPQGSQWIDLYVNLWSTDTVSDTYNAGGFPNATQGFIEDGAPPILENTALGNSTNLRNGITLSNKITFTDNISLTVGGDFQHEKLSTEDEFLVDDRTGRSFPRAGRREEWNTKFNVEWKPLEFLTLNAGARYGSYWSFDDLAAAHGDEITSIYTESYSVSQYYTYYYRTPEQIIEQIAKYELWHAFGILDDESFAINMGKLKDPVLVQHKPEEGEFTDWVPDADGNYHIADNPCLNGAINHIESIASCTLIENYKDLNFSEVKKKGKITAGHHTFQPHLILVIIAAPTFNITRPSVFPVCLRALSAFQQHLLLGT